MRRLPLRRSARSDEEGPASEDAGFPSPSPRPSPSPVLSGVRQSLRFFVFSNLREGSLEVGGWAGMRGTSQAPKSETIFGKNRKPFTCTDAFTFTRGFHADRRALQFISVRLPRVTLNCDSDCCPTVEEERSCEEKARSSGHSLGNTKRTEYEEVNEMLLRWFPWRLVISRVARARGLVDPVAILSRLESFAQPMEVKEPLELLRAGLVFHARGLLNTSAIQHNLDWIWPYWVERQYDPKDVSFIPRAFSITHVNLTNRNWTAVGTPDGEELPVVDPRGLVTPFWDSWSIDFWIAAGEDQLYPSRLTHVDQYLDMERGVAVVTDSARGALRLLVRTEVEIEEGRPVCRMTATADTALPGWLAVSLRPYNPEGVSFVHRITSGEDGLEWDVDGTGIVRFDGRPERMIVSDYRRGDVYTRLHEDEKERRVSCHVGMATAAALYRLEGSPVIAGVSIPLEKKVPSRRRPSWADALRGVTRASLPDEHYQMLWDAALRSIILHSPEEVYPGPYTYRRFWFRDAAFILHALLATGMSDRAERTIDSFPSRQKRNGFFLSQEGEWDSNGEALWIMNRFCELAGREPKTEWLRSIRRGAAWIERKRLKAPGTAHAGLLPAGFSAEHLGPNDYYYWDDFWGVAGFRAAAAMLERVGDEKTAVDYRRMADDLTHCIDESLAGAATRIGRPAMPASPYRRLDSGSIGSLAAGYPTAVCEPRDPRLVDTAEYLLHNCIVEGGFYQDIIHSGINPYLTLHLAQVLLRAGDARAFDLMETIARIATSAGQWPEAVHPATGGGCMGDGHHVWASSEWLLMIRNCFVREEGTRIVLGSGILPRWLEQDRPIQFGPAPTTFGSVRVLILPRDHHVVEVSWQGEWRDVIPSIEISLPGFAPISAERGETTVSCERVETR
jgi:hypothetical protein